MWNNGLKEIGGEMPDNYYDKVEDPIANGESGKDGDLEMDDAASVVGTPEEEVQVKKEKMAEFEKAAMEVEKEMLNVRNHGNPSTLPTTMLYLGTTV